MAEKFKYRRKVISELTIDNIETRNLKLETCSKRVKIPIYQTEVLSLILGFRMETSNATKARSMLSAAVAELLC